MAELIEFVAEIVKVQQLQNTMAVRVTIDLPESWRKAFAPKTYLMLFKSGFAGDKLPSNLWFEYGSGGIVCNPTGAHKDWLYYTNYTADGLGHRFRRVSKEEVDAYQYTEPSTAATDDPSDDDAADSTTLTAISGGLFPLNSVTTIEGSILSKGDEPVVITVKAIES